MRIARIGGVSLALAAALVARDVRAGDDAKSDPGTLITRVDAPVGKAFKYHWTESSKVDAVSGYGDPSDSASECDLVLTAGQRAGDGTHFEVSVGPAKARTTGTGKASLDTSKAAASSLGRGPADKLLLAKDAVILASQKFGFALSDRLVQNGTWGLTEAWNAYKSKLGAAQRKWADGLSQPWSAARSAFDLNTLFAVSDTMPGVARRAVEIGPGCTDEVELIDDNFVVMSMKRKALLSTEQLTWSVRLQLSRHDGMPVDSRHEEERLTLSGLMSREWTKKTNVTTTLTRTATVEPKPAGPAPAKPDDGK